MAGVTAPVSPVGQPPADRLLRDHVGDERGTALGDPRVAAEDQAASPQRQAKPGQGPYGAHRSTKSPGRGPQARPALRSRSRGPQARPALPPAPSRVDPPTEATGREPARAANAPPRPRFRDRARRDDRSGRGRAGRDRAVGQRKNAAERGISAAPPVAGCHSAPANRPQSSLYCRASSRAIARPRAIGGGTTCGPRGRRGESVPPRTVAPNRREPDS